MPVTSRKKRITQEPEASTAEPSSPTLPGQQEFHLHLRTLAQGVVRKVRETVMIEELDAFIGAAWGECSRQQQRIAQRHLHARSGHLDRSDRRYQGSQRS